MLAFSDPIAKSDDPLLVSGTKRRINLLGEIIYRASDLF